MSDKVKREAGFELTEFESAIQRNFTISRAEMDEDDDELLWMSISSEREIEDWPGVYMSLEHSTDAVRLDRLTSAGVGRDRHGGDQVCSVERVELADRKLRVAVRFCSGERAQEIKKDALRNVRRNVSIDAEIHRAVLRETRDDGMTEVYQATDWEPFGFAFTPYPADTSVGVNRAAKIAKPKTERKEQKMEDKDKAQGPSLESIRQDVAAEERAKVERELSEAKKFQNAASNHANMIEIGTKHGCMDIARKAIESGMSMEDFNAKVLDHVSENAEKKVVGRQNPEAAIVGMDDKQVEEYSIMRGVRGLLNNSLNGLELEMHQEISRKLGKNTDGFFVPGDIANTKLSRLSSGVRRMLSRATMAAGNFGTGGATVPTDTLSMIELLRNLTVCIEMGAVTLRDLVGDVVIPRQTAGATILSKAENASATETNATTDDIKMTPHRLTAVVPASKQLIAQSSVDVEMWLREDLMRQSAIELDRQCIFGDGADGEALGIVNVTGIGSITYGAAATWAKVVEHQVAVAQDNALLGSLGYVISPAAMGKWKTKSKDAGSGQFIMSGNTVDDYMTMVTNQIGSSDNRSIFGNWADMLIGFWSGMEITVDPYSRKKEAIVEIQIDQNFDTALRHPESFSVSSDSAAQ